MTVLAYPKFDETQKNCVIKGYKDCGSGFISGYQVGAKIKVAVYDRGIDHAKLAQTLGNEAYEIEYCAKSNYQSCLNYFEKLVKAVSSANFDDIVNENTLEPITFFYTDYGLAGLGLLDKSFKAAPTDPTNPIGFLLFVYEDIVSEINQLNTTHFDADPQPSDVVDRILVLKSYLETIDETFSYCQEQKNAMLCQTRVDEVLNEIEP